MDGDLSILVLFLWGALADTNPGCYKRFSDLSVLTQVPAVTWRQQSKFEVSNGE